MNTIARKGKLGMSVAAVVVASSVVVACSVDSNGDSSVGQSADDLAGCASSAAWWKTQYGDPSPGSCEGPTYYTNCGPATMAMMRYALTCGKSNKTAAQMRTMIIDDVIGTSKTTAQKCAGTDPAEWKKVLDEVDTDHSGNWAGDDKLPPFPTTNHCVSSGANANYSASDLAADMASGAVLVAGVAGRYTGSDPKSCADDTTSKTCCTDSSAQCGPCGWHESGGHALFISGWNGSTFTVYDPDSHKSSSGAFARCGSSKTVSSNGVKASYKAQWTKAQLTKWSGGFAGANSGQLCVLTGHRPCTPGATKSCGTDLTQTCGSDFKWGACECTPGATESCVSPDCCGQCGHGTRTCQPDHTWSGYVCQNGC